MNLKMCIERFSFSFFACRRAVLTVKRCSGALGLNLTLLVNQSPLQGYLSVLWGSCVCLCVCQRGWVKASQESINSWLIHLALIHLAAKRCKTALLFFFRYYLLDLLTHFRMGPQRRSQTLLQFWLLFTLYLLYAYCCRSLSLLWKNLWTTRSKHFLSADFRRLLLCETVSFFLILTCSCWEQLVSGGDKEKREQRLKIVSGVQMWMHLKLSSFVHLSWCDL